MLHTVHLDFPKQFINDMPNETIYVVWNFDSTLNGKITISYTPLKTTERMSLEFPLHSKFIQFLFLFCILKFKTCFFSIKIYRNHRITANTIYYLTMLLNFSYGMKLFGEFFFYVSNESDHQWPLEIDMNVDAYNYFLAHQM